MRLDPNASGLFKEILDMVDRVIRKKQTAELLGISETTRWRLERLGVLVPVQIMPGITGYRESEIQAFIESRERAVPNTARMAAALASPRHGRAGRVAAGLGDAA